MNVILERIENLRKSHDMKAYQLCDAIGVRQNTFTTWKSRDSMPDAVNLGKIAEVFSVSTDYLIYGKERCGSLDEKQTEILNRFNAMDDDGKFLLMEYADFLIVKHGELK